MIHSHWMIRLHLLTFLLRRNSWDKAENSQEDAGAQEEEERVLHQVRVSRDEPGQFGVHLRQLLHPTLPGLEHGPQTAERTAAVRRLHPETCDRQSMSDGAYRTQLEWL